MFFLQFMLYSSFFVGTLVKNEIPKAALKLCQLNINQLSPDILKFRTKHEDNQDNSFTLNCFVVCRSFLFILMQDRVDWVLIIFGTQVIKKKRPVRPMFPDYLSVSYDYAFIVFRSSISFPRIIFSYITAFENLWLSPMKQQKVENQQQQH